MAEFSTNKSTDKTEFLDKAKAARMERSKEKESNDKAVIIQALARGYLLRTRLSKEILSELDATIPEVDDDLTLSTTEAKDAALVFRVIRRFLFIFNAKRDRARFDKICRYILATMYLPKFDVKVSYIAIGCNKEYSIVWIHQLKQILWQAASYMKTLRPEVTQDHKPLMLYLNMLLTFTSSSTWKIHDALRTPMQQLCINIVNTLISRGLLAALQAILLKGLCRTQISLKKTELSAIATIATRHATYTDCSSSSINLLLLHIISVPAFIHHLPQESLKLFNNASNRNTSAKEKIAIFTALLDFLSDEQNSKILFNVLEGNYALCMLANVIQLGALNLDILKDRTLDFVTIVRRFIQSCQKYVVNKQSSLTYWHPILGWFSQREQDSGLHESLGAVRQQLSLLWSSNVVLLLFNVLFEFNEQQNAEQLYEQQQQAERNRLHESTNLAAGASAIRRAFEKASTALTKTTDGLLPSSAASTSYPQLIGKPKVTTVAVVCSMYTEALGTLSQLKMEILTGLCYHETILKNLWLFITCLGPKNGLTAYLDHLALNTKTNAPEFQLLILFCDCTSQLIMILDDIEMYEKQKPFTLQDYIAISSFLNNFVFKIIWQNLIDLKTANSNTLLNSTHTLLMILYKRDCRRNYAPKDHWLIRDLKVSAFMKDLENGKRAAQLLLQKVPHIIPHEQRVILFRKHVMNEKAVLGLTDSAYHPSTHSSTMITVHRTRIVEDGYQQLAVLPVHALKGIIRVKFVNQQGLDEAGIDQDGVFKEFLEETIKKVFDPSLNLFRVTSGEQLYPSATSFIHENHLELFEFVGRVLGKAVYEGIVVDVPFASFFLGQVLRQQQSALYSSIDELPSLDPELYKNLTYIKHYDGDIGDLGLTFSVDEDYMGKIVTHELMTGGRVVPVTKETRINYIHLMAHFRMHTQIREQTAAFIRGFRSIVNPEWLTMFSTSEFQRLISGDNTPVDLVDLRRNTKYYGGFHNNHRVISWLWDIFENDFTTEEIHKFLKFVMSCSKPPLLGFVHLEPPFSIRCVEVGDDQDIGDTVGSVLRGFFTIRRRDPINRLPTSSTCFNLLKLPNYQKKSTLREKLRYAISNNTGFELS